MTALDFLILSLGQYKYILLVPLSVIVGPIIAIASGFLVSTGALNIYITYAVLICGEMAGDTMYYLIGRFAGLGFIRKSGKYFGIDEHSLKTTSDALQRHGSKIYILGKMQGFGSLILMAAGITKVPFPRYIVKNTSITVVKTFTLILFGLYFGYAYNQINEYALQIAVFSTLVIVMLTFAYYIYRRKIKRIS
jgi:membrane-associated protein